MSDRDDRKRSIASAHYQRALLYLYLNPKNKFCLAKSKYKLSPVGANSPIELGEVAAKG